MRVPGFVADAAVGTWKNPMRARVVKGHSSGINPAQIDMGCYNDCIADCNLVCSGFQSSLERTKRLEFCRYTCIQKCGRPDLVAADGGGGDGGGSGSASVHGHRLAVYLDGACVSGC